MPLQGTLAYPLGVPPNGLSSDQVLDLIIQLLPVGAARLYGLRRRAGDPFNFFAAIADSLKAYWYDGIAILRQEINPATTAYKLSEWEAALGLSQTPIALGGNGAQRQQQIISKLREQGAFTVANIQAIVGPLLGMNPANVTVTESNQASITSAHTYANTFGASIGANSSVAQNVFVNDGGAVSDDGAQVRITCTSTNPEQLVATLTSPAGVVYSAFASFPAGAVTGGVLSANFTTLAGVAFAPGRWVLTLSTGAATCTLTSWTLFVEGTAQGQDTAGARFWWSVYADPAHLGETGTSPNFPAARAAILRLTPAHAQARLVQKFSPHPDVATEAIPDECYPA